MFEPTTIRTNNLDPWNISLEGVRLGGGVPGERSDFEKRGGARSASGKICRSAERWFSSFFFLLTFLRFSMFDFGRKRSTGTICWSAERRSSGTRSDGGGPGVNSVPRSDPFWHRRSALRSIPDSPLRAPLGSVLQPIFPSALRAPRLPRNHCKKRI
jgi:hypothetical protein